MNSTPLLPAPPPVGADDFLPPLVGAQPWQRTTGRLTLQAVRAAARESVADAGAALRRLIRTPSAVAATAAVAVALVMTLVLWRDALVTQARPAAAFLAPLAVIAGLRAADVTLGVLKTTCIVQGRRAAAAAFAATEALVWLTAAGIVLTQFTPARVAAFAVGVGSGTWLGMAVVHRLRLGLVTIRLFVPVGRGREDAGRMAAERIRRLGFGATLFSGEGLQGPVAMVLAVARRREAAAICTAVQQLDPYVMVTIDNHPGPGSVVGGVSGG